MAVLGNIIKSAIHLRKHLTINKDSAFDVQQKMLKGLLSKAKDTAFGRHYRFNEILGSSDQATQFASRIPVFDYNKIFEAWWHRTLNGEADVCWPGEVHYFALSSGTTGSESKRIPVTNDMIKAIRGTSIQQILSLANFDLPAEVFEKEILMLGSSTDLEEREGHLEGEISGISAGNIPFWFERYYKPGKDISKINDWDKRIHEIAVKAPEWDIGALSGIPAWIQLMLEKVIEVQELKHIHEIWPNLSIYATGGVAFEPYKKSFERLLGRGIFYVDTYLASEGFLAYQPRPETDAMKLAIDSGIYFEFIPFNESNFSENGDLVDKAKVIGIQEVEEGTDYALLITTCAGAWRYMIGDTIRFTDIDRNEIVITGRTKHFLNVAGSQLSVEKMDTAIKKLEENLEVSIKEYTVAAIEHQGGFAHKWYIGCEETIKNNLAKEKLDQYLTGLNKNYGVARQKALKDIFVEVVPPDYFYQWHEKTKKLGGQVKTPRVMKPEQFAEWEAFVTSKNGT